MEFNNDDHPGVLAVTKFNLDKSLSAIEYSSTDDILELHHSINTTRVLLEDHPANNCDAYLCALKKVEAPHVYIAVRFMETQKTYVYTPEKQPADMIECEKVMQDAVDFVGVAGLMMDSLPLDGEKELLEMVIRKIPVFNRIDKEGNA